MWKLLGAGLLMGGGLRIGLGMAGETSRRIRALESWESALTLFAGELSFRLPDMAELLELLSRRTPGPAGEALAAVWTGLKELGERSFGEIWRGGLEEHGGGLAAEDLEPLYRLGELLGRYDGQEQRGAAERTRQLLAERAARLREELRREGKVYGALGLSMGAFLTILLL